MKLIFLGPPGSGKGTQSMRLKKEFSIETISTGDLLRFELENNTEVGLQAKKYMDNGGLVPDDIVLSLIEKKIVNLNNYILDGFPRNMKQALDLDILLKRINHNIDLVVNFVVDDEILIKRITGRYICVECGEVYNDYFKQTKVEGVCDNCQSQNFKRRSDDNEDILRNRLKIFHQSNDALCEYYEKNNLLISLQAVKNEDFIFKNLKNIIENKIKT